MMKKFLLPLALTAVGFTSVAANGDILSEDFDGMGATLGVWYNELAFTDDWKIVNQHEDAELPNRWCLYHTEDSNNTSIETRKAWIDLSGYSDNTAGVSLLETPVLDLTTQCELSFQWSSSGMALDYKQYDLRVYVIEEGKDIDLDNYTFSILNADMVLESGIQPTSYDWYSVPWVGWSKYTSKIDLTKWKGQKVRVAFAYVITDVTNSWNDGRDKINSVEVDNVRVYPKEQATAPEATLSTTSWNFGKVYVGASVWSDAITLTNTGTSGLKITGVEAPEGFSVEFAKEMSEIDLKKNESVSFVVRYNASLTSAASGNIVIKTNGNNATLAVSATKQMLPDGAVFEGFEGEAFPPAGWTAKAWNVTSTALEGEKSAICTAYYQQENYLRTPRIDASKEPASISFTYYDYYNGEEEGYDTEVQLQFSSDGGETWETVDTFDYEDAYNTITNVSYTKEANSDNCYWQFVWDLTYYDSENGAEASIYYLDSVVLTNLYGANGTPTAATATSPADGETNVFHRDTQLQWTPAQFANGYRLYVGTDAEATNLVNGVDLGDALSYTLPTLAYATVYNWKVVPYNDKGDCTDVATWHFTTLADPTITSFPYYEGFNNGVPPTGWRTYSDGVSKWAANEYEPFEGTACAMANVRDDVDGIYLETPDVKISEPAILSFYWGDGVAVNLLTDNSGTVTNNTNGYDGISKTTFEILVDGEWHELDMLSDKTNSYWIRSRIDLTPYVGKTVAFRWVYSYEDYMKVNGACIDKFAIEPASDVKISLNSDGYDAGKVNHDESFTTESSFTIYNDGSKDAEIKSATFNNSVFSTSLKAGDKIAVGSALPFSLSVNANDANTTIDDVLTITTTDGSVATLPVKAEILPADTRFYGFERDEYGTLNPKELYTIDVDRRSTVELLMVDYAHYGEPMAFVVMNHKKADWPICYANTGDQCLVTFGAAADDEDVEDWIISPKMLATDQSSFDFYCRDYLSNDDDRFGKATATVLVSTTGGTDRSTFTEVKSNQVPQPDPTDKQYTKFSIDLKKYAGQEIWVALRHTVNNGLAYFYDDFQFNHFNSFESGILNVVSSKAGLGLRYSAATETVTLSGADAANITVTSMTGATVAAANNAKSINVEHLASGVYIVTAKSANGTTSQRFIKR
jgi:hypothetical protein